MADQTESCGNCGGLGRTFDSAHRPVRCAPCTEERQEEWLQRGKRTAPECRACTAVVTVPEYDAWPTRPARVKAYGLLCADCAEGYGRVVA